MARGLTLGFLRTATGAGLVLASAAAAALMAASSPLSQRYFSLIGSPIPVRLGGFEEIMSLAQWVRQALMPVFFLVITMQLKFEILRGEISSVRRAALPLAAAIGGLVVPAAVLFGLAGSSAGGLVAAAGGTDIPLALAALALAAPRAAGGARVLLLSIALLDDVGAAVLASAAQISVVYFPGLAAAAGSLAVLFALSRWRKAPFFFYAVLFVLVWAFALESGLNPSLAGVACALAVPVGPRRPGQDSVVQFFVASLLPYVAFAVLPLMVFTGAGIELERLGPLRPAGRDAMALFIALALGRPTGVLVFAGLAALLRLARRPPAMTWIDLAGVAWLSGAGLSVSLFALAPYRSPADENLRGAAIAASLAALAMGALVLRLAHSRRPGAVETEIG